MPIPMIRPAILLCCASAFLPCQSLGQAKEPYGTLFMKTKIGSFKLVGNRGMPAEGRVEVSFTGSLLITGTPKLSITGDVRREYNSPKHEKQVFFGKGKAVIEGKFWGIQWFGRDMSAKWTGFGIARLTGEFDNELKTGEYWYSDDPSDIRYFPTSLGEISNPPRRSTPVGTTPQPRKRG